jgi:hypothetical protein
MSSGEDGDIGKAFKESLDNDPVFKKINEANRANIYSIIGMYKSVEHGCQKIRCPFKNHKGGGESTPSFYIYQQTNTFWCYGCSSGSTPCDFVAIMDDIGKLSAAEKILKLSGIDNAYGDADSDTYTNTSGIVIDFSSFIRDQIKKNPSNLNLIEDACKKFDELCAKYDAYNDEIFLNSLIEKIKNKLYLRLNSKS